MARKTHKVEFDPTPHGDFRLVLNGVPEGTLTDTHDGFWIVELDNGKTRHCKGITEAKRWARQNVTQTVTPEQWERGW